jgi:general secretion pathway protein D
VLLQAKFVRSFNNAMSIRDQKERGFVASLEGVERASVPWDDNKVIDFPNPRDWKSLSDRRGKKWLSEQQRRRSERDIEIEQKLKTPVAFQFSNQPLGQVIEQIGRIAGVNVYLDPQGLADEGATVDTPVTIKLDHEISLKSALNLILQPLRLNYIIKDEVLKITSEALRGGQLYTMTYNVADLVMPIPNFSPRQMGLDSAYSKAMSNVGFGGASPFATPGSSAALVAEGGQSSGTISANVLAQSRSSGGGGSSRGFQTGSPQGNGLPNGPGGAAGGSGADFDSLIDLIVGTVKPESWDEVGGRGSVRGFETNLSLVVSQTQEVHEEIADLLEQLRRLQDLQVTIEVRYITLSDQFYERIGVAFDMNFNSNLDGNSAISATTVSGGGATSGASKSDGSKGVGPNASGANSATVGLSSPGVYSSDLDIQLSQARSGSNSSYSQSIPNLANTLAGGDPYGGASIGFAILSDIEAYFFINAAQGDVRSNVLQAPKVTLFNGQQAFVSDTSQSPFVISVIPVVGDFAAAQQPVIVVLSEGTFLTVQAVVSNDRRFVRLTVVPFFSKIGNVSTFTFTGSTTTTENNSAQGVQEDPNDNSSASASKTTAATGTTVQLPTFAYVTVTTTVSVPDGGTVLLGGIKRLTEERKEYGTPMLNKIPYISRLFRNTGVGRDASSLMMMVTPRIIIQEEEEQALGIQP